MEFLFTLAIIGVVIALPVIVVVALFTSPGLVAWGFLVAFVYELFNRRRSQHTISGSGKFQPLSEETKERIQRERERYLAERKRKGLPTETPEEKKEKEWDRYLNSPTSFVVKLDPKRLPK